MHYSSFVAALGLLALTAPCVASPPSEHVVHAFKGGADGFSPGQLIPDPEGNLFGANGSGGQTPCHLYAARGCGTIFEIMPPSANRAKWTTATIYRFQNYVDGAFPEGNLVRLADGRLIGTTVAGGIANCPVGPQGEIGCGTVFMLTPPAHGQSAWTKSTIYAFSSATDGDIPANLVLDASGRLLGTTLEGGAGPCSCGSIFRLTPPSSGGTGWTKSTLYSFQGIPRGTSTGDGANPTGFAIAADGTLYGATAYGGRYSGGEGGGSFGILFSLAPPAQGGAWSEKMLYRFSAKEQNPVSAPVLDAAGNLFGTTYTEAFELSAGRLAAIHVFSGQNGNGDGFLPYGGVVLGPNGWLYGTTIGGGAGSSYGTVYRLHQPPHGTAWQETILHSFAASPDGSAPDAPPVFGAGGVLYGTTLRGGNKGCRVYAGDIGCGTVFSIDNP